MTKKPHETQPRCPVGKFGKTTAANGCMDTRAYPKQKHAIEVKSAVKKP